MEKPLNESKFASETAITQNREVGNSFNGRKIIAKSLPNFEQKSAYEQAFDRSLAF